jgi:N-acetylneuraminic acid mutarotase
MGGASGPNVYLGSVAAFDPATNTWSAPPDMPTARAYFGATTDKNDLIYVLAGEMYRTSCSWRRRSQSQWATKSSLPGSNIYAAAATGGDGKVYLLGAPSLVAPGSMTAYTPPTNTWTAAAAPGNNGCSLVAGTDGRLYAIGGIDAQGTTSPVRIYDTAAGACSDGARLDRPRDLHIAAPLAAGRIFVAGGTNLLEGNFMAVADIYDPKANMWSVASDAPATLSGAAASTGHDGRVYIAGSLANAQANIALFVFNPTTNRWVWQPI